MIRLVLFLLALTSPLMAEPARIYSGEHGTFTRLVVELPAAADWAVGRTAEGYAFAVTGAKLPDYDLASVWQRIARTRIAALDSDPEQGALLLTLGCDCHLFPFEFQPGVVVLDVKPGPAPQGSTFEAAFVAPAFGPPSQTGDETAMAYNWIKGLPKAVARQTDLPLPLPTGEISLEPVRDALLEQIARGAADGIVDMGRALPAMTEAPAVEDALPWSNIRIGEQPGVRITEPADRTDGPGPAATCAKDDLLDLAAWGKDASPMDILVKARTGLYGEFDAPDTEAVLQSVRLHLYLGFGAEARQLAELPGLDADESTLVLYRSMARLVDGESDPDTPFSDMLDCDGPASLWAALARDRLPPGPGVNSDAILRSYLALPPHLRGHLGSPLAEKLLAYGDADAARMIRDAMERAPEADPGDVALLDAETDLFQGDAEAARDHALEAVALDGNEAEALIALVETHVRQLDPISPDVPEALMALRGEIGDPALGAAVDRAIVLALGLSGQSDAAFQHPGAEGKTREELWRVLQDRASDDDFLRHAVLPQDVQPPDLQPELGLGIASRLVALGFPDAALTWLGDTQASDAPDRRLVAAEAELDRGDAQTAIDLLSELPGPEAAGLRANALVQLGDLAAAERSLSAAGNTEAGLRAGLWRGDWSNVDPTAPEAWQAAARLAQPAEADADKGLLGRGADALETSADARSSIETLLGAVAGPEGN